MSINLSPSQLKIAALYALRAAGGLLPETALQDILTSCDINGLLLSEAISFLEEDGHIVRYYDDSVHYLKISPTGVVINDGLKSDVPVTLREKLAARAAEEVSVQRSKLIVNADVRETADGCDVTLTLSDGEVHLMSCTLSTPTKFQADMIAKKFSDNPTAVYKKIIAAVTGQ